MTARDARKSVPDYISLLIQVQYSIQSNDTQKANLLRDKSEDIDDLTDAEIEWLYGVSGDLDMLTGDETFEAGELTPPQLVAALRERSEAGDGDGMLERLRQMSFLDTEHRAYFRARAYAVLGFTELAVVFIRLAAELSGNSVPQEMALAA